MFLVCALRSLLCCTGGPVPEAEASFGALSTDAAELSTGRDVAMAGTAPADAELLDDADTETAAAAADRSVKHPSSSLPKSCCSML